MNGLNLAQLPAQNELNQLMGAVETFEKSAQLGGPNVTINTFRGVRNPAIAEIINTDPLDILEEQYNRGVQQLDVGFAESRQLATRKSRNQMDILQRRYEIDVNTLRNKYESVPRSKRTKESLQQAWNDWNQLNAQYAKQAEQIQGKTEPDLMDLEAGKQQQLQELQFKRDEKRIKINTIRELAAKDFIKDPYAALQEQYAVIGYNIPTSEFRPPDVRGALKELIAQKLDAIRSGDTQTTEAISQRVEPLLSQLPLNEANAIRKSTQLSELGAKRKKRGPEEPGTFAEGIMAAKPITRMEKARGQLGLQPTPEELRNRGTKEAYEQGKRLGYWD